eukprot:gene22107-29166_t
MAGAHLPAQEREGEKVQKVLFPTTGELGSKRKTDAVMWHQEAWRKLLGMKEVSKCVIATTQHNVKNEKLATQGYPTTRINDRHRTRTVCWATAWALALVAGKNYRKKSNIDSARSSGSIISIVFNRSSDIDSIGSIIVCSSSNSIIHSYSSWFSIPS